MQNPKSLNDLLSEEKLAKQLELPLLTPAKAIRKFCLWCMNSSSCEIQLCPSTECALYPFRFGKGRGRKLKATRLKCIDCVAGEIKRVTNCEFDGKDEELCPLFPYRMGKNPKLKGLRKGKVSLKALGALKTYRAIRKNRKKGYCGEKGEA